MSWWKPSSRTSTALVSRLRRGRSRTCARRHPGRRGTRRLDDGDLAVVLRTAGPAACQWLSRELRTVVSTVTTTDAEGWSHTLFGCGTVLDRFHSFPASLAWDDEDVAALSREWAGDFELVARVFGVDACADPQALLPGHVRHPRRTPAASATATSRCGPRWGSGRPTTAPYAVLAVDPAW